MKLTLNLCAVPWFSSYNFFSGSGDVLGYPRPIYYKLCPSLIMHVLLYADLHKEAVFLQTVLVELDRSLQ